MQPSELKNCFDKQGYVILKDFLTPAELASFRDCALHLYEREEKPGNPMKYFEQSFQSGAELLNRVENFVEQYENIKKIVWGEKINNLLEELSQKKQQLFKDKINFKLPGGGGFAVHQDAPAFSSFTQHELLIFMVPVDVSTVDNGCMQVAENYFSREVVRHVGGKIPDEMLTFIRWRNIELSPGDVLIFSSFLIHRSADNTSHQPRRCFYLTFNDAQEGNLREKYFDYKRKNFPPRIERALENDFSAWKSKLAKAIL